MQPQRPARRRSPREDKDLDYERQAVSGSAYGFRQHWPQRKASLHRGRRRAKTAALAQPRTIADPAAADRAESRVVGVRRRGERNWNQSNLGDHVADRVADRALDMIDTFAAGEYRPASQRAPMVRALTILVRRRPARRPVDGRMRRTAYALDDLFVEPALAWGSPDTTKSRRRREWFAAFLDDQPEWGARLRSWITDVLS